MSTRLDIVCFTWPAKRELRNEQSPLHPCIKTSATLVIDSHDNVVKNKGTLCQAVRPSLNIINIAHSERSLYVKKHFRRQCYIKRRPAFISKVRQEELEL